MLGDETDNCSNHTALSRPSKVVLFAINLTVGTAATLVAWHRRKFPNDEVLTMEVAMSLRTMIAAGALGLISVTTDAFGQGQYRVYYAPNPNPFFDFILALAFVLAPIFAIAWLAGWLPSEPPDAPCDCAECVAEREASLMLEITKHQDTHTAMMRSEIELTRVSAVYGERPDIAAHEQRLHELRNQLTEMRQK